MHCRLFSALLCTAAAAWIGVVSLAGQSGDAVEHLRSHPALQYDTRPTRDPVAQLLRQIEAGTRRLSSESPSAYLRSLLDALDVPVASQMAVFSKGSLQASRIEFDNPRALYFNDSVSVGWVRGGIIEIASQDPAQGTVFYVVEPGRFGSPSIQRRDERCLTCHDTPLTLGVPGMRLGTDHRTPLERRWGGWFVTGHLGGIEHFGNVDIARFGVSRPPTSPFNWPSFDGKFDWAGYLAPHSDAAALLVFEHQMRLMNLLTRIGWEARVARHDQRPFDGLAERAAEVADYLLFVDEAPMASPIRGSSGFADAFSARGPRDHRGRSLRQLDLQTRLLRYPCSYMVYAPQFDALPGEVKTAVYDRLWTILSGADRSAKYRHLSTADGQAIVEILRETKNDLPATFSPAGVRP